MRIVIHAEFDWMPRFSPDDPDPDREMDMLKYHAMAQIQSCPYNQAMLSSDRKIAKAIEEREPTAVIKRLEFDTDYEVDFCEEFEKHVKFFVDGKEVELCRTD